jgi:LacI family transcriptional regulator
VPQASSKEQILLKRKATSTVLAEMLGVSRSTVSRALNGYPYVDENLRKKIVAMASELNYLPNQAARSLAKKVPTPIGVILYTKPGGEGEFCEYVNEVVRGIRFASRRYSDYGLDVEIVMTDISKPEEQLQAIDRLVGKEVRGIVLAPSHPDLAAPMIDKLTARGVQVLLIDTDIPQSSRICFIGSDYQRTGRISAELAGLALGGKGRVAMIAFDECGTMIPEKLSGFRQEMYNYPQIEILGPFKFSRIGKHVYEDTLELITQYKPDAIFMTYGQLADVARAVEDSGETGKIAIIGYDTSSQVLDLLKRRVITAVINQDPVQQGALCIQVLYDYLLLNVRPLSSVIHARLDIVTSQNCSYFRRKALNVLTYNYLERNGAI